MLPDPRRQNLFRRSQPIQVEMKQFQPSAAVFVDQRECRRMHAARNAQPALGGASKLFAKRLGFRRAAGTQAGDGRTNCILGHVDEQCYAHTTLNKQPVGHKPGGLAAAAWITARFWRRWFW